MAQVFVFDGFEVRVMMVFLNSRGLLSAAKTNAKPAATRLTIRSIRSRPMTTSRGTAAGFFGPGRSRANMSPEDFFGTGEGYNARKTEARERRCNMAAPGA